MNILRKLYPWSIYIAKSRIKGAVSMRIDRVSSIYDTYSTQSATHSKGVDKVKSKDEVKLSTQAKDFATIRQKLADVPDVREDMVQDIKVRMKQGTYEVSSSDIAQKILSQFDFKG